MKFAVTLPRPVILVGVVPPAAAHKFTAVQASASPITLPAHRAQNPHAGVVITIVGRFVDVDKVFAAGLFVEVLRAFQSQEYGLPLPLALDGHDPLGAVVPLHQRVADHPKAGQSRPASFNSARP